MANNFLSTSELDYNTYKNNLKNFLKNQTAFRDYNFEASNMSVLLDLLAYNTYQNAFYLNMVGNEAFLDTALLSESVVSHSKALNYTPRSRVSAQATLAITITPPGPTYPSTITIPKGYYVTTTSNNTTYLFTTDQSYIVRNNGGTYTSDPIVFYEGRNVTETFPVVTGKRYIISSANVDISSITVNVQNSQTDTANTNYTRAYNLYGLAPTDTVFFVQGYGAAQYEVVFGNDITGKAVNVGNIVKIKYRETSGEEANYLSRFTPLSGIETYNSVVASTTSASSGGAERENIDSIKFNAPRHFAAQDRAITKNDFLVLIKANFPSIQSIAIFGGETLEEKQYGRVAIATKPFNAEITPDATKNAIAAFLSTRTTISIEPIFLDPDYFYVGVTSIVNYDPTATDLSVNDIETLVRNKVQDYNDQQLSNFNTDFRFSKLVASIDSVDESVVSNETKVTMIKKIAPVYNNPESFTINYANKLDSSNEPCVFTDYFYTPYTDGNTYYARIIDDAAGKLKLVTNNDQTLLTSDVGTVDYTTGKIVIDTITHVNPVTVSTINVNARTVEADIIISQQQIIQIDQSDVAVTVESI